MFSVGSFTFCLSSSAIHGGRLGNLHGSKVRNAVQMLITHVAFLRPPQREAGHRRPFSPSPRRGVKRQEPEQNTVEVKEEKTDEVVEGSEPTAKKARQEEEDSAASRCVIC